jgi:hypothetical protein
MAYDEYGDNEFEGEGEPDDGEGSETDEEGLE